MSFLQALYFALKLCLSLLTISILLGNHLFKQHRVQVGGNTIHCLHIEQPLQDLLIYGEQATFSKALGMILAVPSCLYYMTLEM